MDDREIVKLLFSRNEDALREIKSKYGRYLFTIAGKVLRNDCEAQECENDVLLATWQSIPPNNPQDLRAYLGALMRRIALKRYDSNRTLKRGAGLTESAYEELEECCGSGEDFTNGLALKEALERFLRSLNKSNRIVFIQKYWFLLTVSEIAKERGMSENAVKVSLFRTREKLKEFLRKEGFIL